MGRLSGVPMRTVRPLLDYLGYVPQPGGSPGSVRRDGRLRRLGADLRKRATALQRRALVHSWASMIVWPGRWFAGVSGVSAVAAAAAAGWWPLAGTLTSLTPWILYRWVSKPSGGRASTILIAVSSRVNTLRLERRLKRRWLPLMVDLGLSRQASRRDKPVTLVPRLGRVRRDDYGVDTTVNLQPLNEGVTALEKRQERIESGLDVPESRIVKVGPGVARLRLRHTDPLVDPITTEMLPTSRRRLHVTTGLDDDGRGVERGLLLPSLTVGGQGSGKSSELATKLWALQQAGIPCRVRIFDPKGGQEFSDLAASAHHYESDPAKWGDFLGAAIGALQKRQRSLAGRGTKELTWFTDTEPLDLMIVDELLAVLAMKNSVNVGGSRIAGDAAFRLYLSQARASGHTVDALSQMGQAEVLGTIRPLFSYATCMRVGPMETAMVDILLGKGASDQYPAHEIPVSRPGLGYTRVEGWISRYRAAYLTGEQRAGVAVRMKADTARYREARAAARGQKTEAAA